MTTTATYNKVKTNIAWMPELPEHWKLCRVKNYFTFSNEVVGEDYSGFNVLSLSVNGVIIRDMESGKGKHSMSMDLYQIVQPKSIILCLFDMDVTPRIVGICENLGIITSAYTTIVPKENVCERFYYYFFLHQDYNKSLKAQGTGVRTTLTNTQFGAVKIPVPPYQEQIQIAQYLDTQSQKINHFIAKKQQFIALLKEQRQSVINEAVTKGINKKVKLKDSGIEWLGDVPEHWVIMRLKNIAKICNGSECDKQDEGLYPVYGSGGIFGRFDKFLYNKPSVLLGRKGTVDKPILVSEPFWSVDTAFYTKIDEGVSLPLYFYYLCTTINFDLYSTKTALPSMTQTDLYKVKFVVPPLEEQDQIVNHIKTETTTIDTAIAKTLKEIELIKEYKEAMIAEAVMGKVNFNKK